MPSSWKIHEGDSLEILRELPEQSVDSIVTDPPYGLGFMGKAWDSLPPGEEIGKRLLRVAKPGAHIVAFGGTRTYHRLACALEDAGWEIRDCLMWLYGSGFPKSHNLDGDWDGWGTALKPACEPIVLARKPLLGTVAGNVAEHGTGALNVDGCRVGDERIEQHGRTGDAFGFTSQEAPGRNWTGRWPANVIHDGSPEATRGMASAERYFYCAKASSAERNAGLEGMDRRQRDFSRHAGQAAMGPDGAGNPYNRGAAEVLNSHPTVKPLALMQWLCRLITPPGGTILDPFLGSGTTLAAALREDFRCVGIEREAEYAALARRRVEEDAPLFNRGGHA